MCTDFLLLRRVHAATDNKTPVFLFYCFSRSEPSPSSLFFDTCLNGDALTKPATSLVQILETKIIHGKYKYLIYSRALISRHCGMSNFHSLYTAPPGDRLRKTIRYKHFSWQNNTSHIETCYCINMLFFSRYCSEENILRVHGDCEELYE